MASTRYVRSTTGSNANGGTSWADAKLDLVGVSAIDTAGDTIWVSQAHAESTAGSIIFAGAGTNPSPTLLLCGNDANTPPTALATTGAVTTTSAGVITMNGALYCYGLIFTAAGGFAINTGAANFQRYESCSLRNGGSNLTVGPTNVANVGTKTEFINCTFKFAGSGEQFFFTGEVVIEGGSMVSGTTSQTGMFASGSDRTHSSIIVSGFDFSNQGAGFNLFVVATGSCARGIVRNCKLPTSWSGAVVGGTLVPGCRYEMHNCDSANTNYRLDVEDYAGSIKSETTVIRSGGASDGTTQLTWKMATSANSSFPTVELRSPEIIIWNDTTGSSKTVTVEIVHDTNVSGGQGSGASFAFQNNEIWLEVQALEDASFPDSTFDVSNRVADVITAASDQATSTTTWTTTGLTTPLKQKLMATFTPQKKGPFVCRVVMARASKTCYVDPLATVV